MSEKVPDKIVEELRKAARSGDLKALGKAINRNKRDLPEDLLEAAEDHRVLKETMRLINKDKVRIYSEGVRLNVEDCCEEERKTRH
ncbi:MAG: hypothetical protein GX088_06585 [Clostridia bacterium]|nr:hypothetical protein [Clostridia bacterium]